MSTPTKVQMQAALQQKLMEHFGNDVNKAKKFIGDCGKLGLDLGDPKVIQNIADRTPVFMNLLVHDLWGTLSTFSRVVDELKR